MRDVRLFEVGRVFLPTPERGFPEEPLYVGLAWSGASSPPHWSGASAAVRLHDVTGLVDDLLDSVRPRAQIRRVIPPPKGLLEGLHPGVSAV